MNRELARIYGTDQPVWERVREGNIRRAFVKTATAEGIDLAKLSDWDALVAFDTFRTLHAREESKQAKTAEAVRIGRHIARDMVKRALGENVGLPLSSDELRYVRQGMPQGLVPPEELERALAHGESGVLSRFSPRGGMEALRGAFKGVPGKGTEALRRLGPTGGALALLGALAFKRKQDREQLREAELAAQGGLAG